MKSNSTIILFILVALVGGYIWFFERASETTREKEERAGRAIRLDPDRVTQLMVEAGEVAATCEKRAGHWEIVEPIKARADAGEMDRILWGLETLERSDIVTEREQKKQGLEPAVYGFDDPRGRIVLGAADRQRAFVVGSDAPMGHSVFMREEGSMDIIVADAGILDLLPEDLASLRDRNLFTGTLYDVARIDIHRPAGFLQLAKAEDDLWLIQQPFAARADHNRVSTLLEDLFAARVGEFVADEVADPAAYGLGEGTLSITLWGDDATEGQTLELGGIVESATNSVYAKLDAYPSVYAAPALPVDALTVHVEDLRDRRLLSRDVRDIGWVALSRDEERLEMARDDTGEWAIVKPLHIGADREQVERALLTWTEVRIDSFIDEVNTNGLPVGLGEPLFRLDLAAVTPVENPEAEAAGETVGDTTVVIYAGEGTGLVAEVVGETSFYRVEASLGEVMSPDYLLYREREVLSLAPADVRMVTVMRDGMTQCVERAESGEFVVREEGAEGVVDQDAIEDILGMVGRLRAERYVTENPDELVPFGLASPVCTLTLGLTGEAGIEKSILFGTPAETGSLHAMVRGEDVVFVVNEVLHAILRRDLYVPAAVE